LFRGLKEMVRREKRRGRKEGLYRLSFSERYR
jgi:hypothetical protein